MATPTPIEEEEPTPTPTPEPVDETLDSDGDYIHDYMENEIGTNPNDPDSDGDGLDDYLELMIGYDPTTTDTDNNGILDGEEDLDIDSLCNINELILETDILSEDTDGDKLKDGEEVYTYGTDPKNPDSDDDGIIDGDEINLGKDPTDPSDAANRIEQTKIQEITNEEDTAITSVEVTISLANSIDRSLTIRDMYNVDMRTTNVPGRIGSPLSFECEEDFDTATVVIHYSEAALGDTAESDLGILWYDEEHGIFVEQEQAILDTSNNKITVELEHFSRYTLVDRSEWNSSGPNVYLAEGLGGSTAERNGVDVYITVHLEGNTTQDDKLEIIRYLEQILELTEDGDRYCFAVYDDNNQVYSNREYYNSTGVFIGDVRSEMMNFQGINVLDWGQQQHNSWTPIDQVDIGNDALTINLFASDRIASSSLSSSMAAGISFTDLSPVVVSGVFHNEVYGVNLNIRQDNTDQMNDIRRILGLEPINATDSDGDGLPDILEEEGMYGLDGLMFTSDPNLIDSDEDGIPDGEEMGTMYSIRRADEDHVQICGTYMAIDDVGTSQYAIFEQHIPEIPGEICFVFDNVRSNPCKKDSDGDGFMDIEDGIPFYENPDIVYILYSASGPFYIDYEMNARQMDYDCIVKTKAISNSDEFRNYWNSMGTAGDDDSDSSDDRYIYHIREVITIFHGQSSRIDMDNTPHITSYDISSLLVHKKIDTLRLSSCNNGNITEEGNIARCFMAWGTIGETYAWDGKAAFIADGEISIILPSLSIWGRDIYVFVNYSWELSGTNFETILRTMLFCPAIVCIVDKDDIALGLVRYYYDSSGNVRYEDVSDSYMYINSFYCG